jgi:hypothetical protein
VISTGLSLKFPNWARATPPKEQIRDKIRKKRRIASDLKG